MTATYSNSLFFDGCGSGNRLVERVAMDQMLGATVCLAAMACAVMLILY